MHHAAERWPWSRLRVLTRAQDSTSVYLLMRLPTTPQGARRIMVETPRLACPLQNFFRTLTVEMNELSLSLLSNTS